MTQSIYIFDLDGTLYPYDQAYYGACVRAVDVVGQGLIKNVFNFMDGDQTRDFARNFANTHGLHESLYGLDRRQQKFLDEARKALSTDFLKPDAALTQSLEDARGSDISLYLMTHSEKKWTDQVLEKRGLAHLFDKDKRITAEDRLGRKSEAGTYRRFLEKFSISADSEVILMDDQFSHKEPAERNGIEFLHVPSHEGVSAVFIQVLNQVIRERQLPSPDQEPRF